MHLMAHLQKKLQCYLLQGYAFLGFIISVSWIFAIANEIVNLLKVSFKNSDAFCCFDCLGVLVLHNIIILYHYFERRASSTAHYLSSITLI